MEIELSPISIIKLAEALAPRVARIIKQQEKEEEEWITTREAAQILSVSPAWLRRTKERYPYIKGEGQQSQIRFLKSALLKNHAS